MRCAAFLRAINLGARRRVSMPDLRAAMIDCGFDDVVTIGQTGNVVFSSDRSRPDELEARLEVELGASLGLPLELLVRTRDEVLKIVSDNPFARQVEHGSKLSVTLLRNEVTDDEASAVEQIDLSPDEAVVIGRALYLWCPNGMGRSRAGGFDWGKVIAPSVASNRNWNTMMKVAEEISR